MDLTSNAQKLDALYAGAERGHVSKSSVAWLVAVALPHVPVTGRRLSLQEVRELLSQAEASREYLKNPSSLRPLRIMGDKSLLQNPRPGLRRWISGTPQTEETGLGEIAVHDDGSLTFAIKASGESEPGPDGSGKITYDRGVRVDRIEYFVADFMTALRKIGQGEYDVRVGLKRHGDDPLTVFMLGGSYTRMETVRTALAYWDYVEASVDTKATEEIFAGAVADLALDCVNQAGVRELSVVRSPRD